MRKLVKGWLSCWLYVIAIIAGVIIGSLISSWSSWTLQAKLVAMSVALLAIHVLEEWRFPGGFHYMYNLMKKSELPDRYPMNQLSDMLTNCIGIVFGCVVLIVGVTPMFAAMQLLLSCGEIVAHASSGFRIKKLYAAKGKRTIYNPGLFTSVFGFLPIAAGIVYSFFAEQPPTVLDLILALAFGAMLMAVSLPIAERLCRSKDTPFPYDWGNGYFDKFSE
jgi:hypothetical protein